MAFLAGLVPIVVIGIRNKNFMEALELTDESKVFSCCFFLLLAVHLSNRGMTTDAIIMGVVCALFLVVLCVGYFRKK